MSKETMWVAFPNGGIIPAAITGDDDRPVEAHEPVKVPADYGRHLVHDRFAYEAEQRGKKPARTGGRADTRPGEAKAGEIRQLVEKLKAELDAADLTQKPDIEARLKTAEAELAAFGQT